MKNFHLWSNQNIVKTLSNLPSSSKFRLFAAEEYDLCKNPNSFLDPTINPIWIFGGADPNYYKNKFPGTVILWHTFFLYWAFNSLDDQFYNKDSNITKTYISMNHRAHSHRCLLMDMLAKHNIINDGIISWRNVDKDPYKFKHWHPKVLKLKDKFLKKYTQHTLPPEYSNALINLISESTTETLFVTEKTYHAIFAGKPFIIQGAPGVHRYLTELGFEMYDEIFDYKFDIVKDDVTRTEMIVKNLKKLKNRDLNLLKKELTAKAERNKQHGINIIKNQEYVPDAIQEFKYYRELTKEAKCKSDLLD